MDEPDAAHEPECRHVKHFVKQIIWKVLYFCSPATAPVHCRLWNLEWGGMQSLECEESGVLSGECCM